MRDGNMPSPPPPPIGYNMRDAAGGGAKKKSSFLFQGNNSIICVICGKNVSAKEIKDFRYQDAINDRHII